MIIVIVLLGFLALYQITCAFSVQIGALVARIRIGRPKTQPAPSISLLVPAKDEEDNIPRLLASLESQIGDLENAVFINDLSSDGTGKILDDFKTRFPDKVSVVHVKSKQPSASPKLEAMKQGIHLIKGDVILMTDADCEVPAGWVNETAAAFRDPDVALTIGPVVTRRTGSLLAGYSAAEHVYRYIGAAGLIGINMAAGGFGNNMAICRDTLDAIGGLDAVAQSVTEDAALICAVRDRPGTKIRAMLSPQASILTQPVESWKALHKQLVRWQVGAVYSEDFFTRYAMSLLIVGYALTLPLFVLGFWWPILWIRPLGTLIGASTMMIGGGIQLRQPPRYWLLLPLQFLLIVMINAWTGVRVFFYSRVEWKGTSVDMSHKGS